MGEILRQKNGGGEIAVPVDMFFVGNDDLGSIGCNLGARQPAISTFYEVLEALRTQSGVQDIWVQICDAEDPSTWPYSDTVYTLTALSKDVVEMALEALHFDSGTEGWMYGKPEAAPEPRQGCMPLSVWWY